MLSLFHGSDLKALAGHLFEELNRNPLSNPLAEEIFVVQNHGMGQWISMQMALKQGVAANLKYEFPAERMWALARMMDPDIPETLASDRGPLTWSILKALNDDLPPELHPLKRYIDDDDSSRQTVRKWKLSDKIADVFDQYLIFRPDLLLAWESGKRPYGTAAEQWQAILWQKLIKEWNNDTLFENYLHRVEVQKKLHYAIDENQLPADELPERITVFGISAMPPVYLQTLIRLSKRIDIRFYQVTVDSLVSDSRQFQNPLLQSLGKEGADFFSLFHQFVHDDPAIAASFESHPISVARQQASTRFQQLRRDLIEDRLPSADGPVLAEDATLQFHSCHSPMREVEVLYNQLLAIFDEHPGLNPDDVLIMTPDIGTYAPMIDAVFGNPDKGQPQIPYSIADRDTSDAQAAIQVFLKMLDVCESRFKVSEVLDLLDADPLKQAFEFTDEDFNRLEKWIDENRIRWGIDAAFKEELELPPTDSFTWTKGVNRMLLGYAMKPDDDQLYKEFFPYDEIETSDDAELAGKFAHFLRKLFIFREHSRRNRKAAEWAELLKQIPDVFLVDSKEYYRECTIIRKTIDKLETYAQLAHYEQEIPFRIIRSWLRQQIENQSSGGGRLGRGVTFSSLVPMRSIAFKMVGMVGMNEGAFPRSKIPAEFDFMHKESRPGDRSRSNDDRYLFLENMLAAEQFLYFSYVGQSNRQDNEYPPSVVLKEFMDYAGHYSWAIDLVQDHPLQAFSPAYFDKSRIFSYSETQHRVATKLVGQISHSNGFMKQHLPEPDEDWKQVGIKDLVAFFQHPAKYLFRKRLGIYLREEEALIEEREPFQLDGLDGYHLGQQLLDRFLKQQSLESYQKIVEAQDVLPEGWSGDRAFRSKVEEVMEFGASIEPFTRQQARELEVERDIGDFRLSGKLVNVYDDYLVNYRFGRSRPKDQLEFWINHLVFQLVKPSNHSGESLLITKEKTGIDEVQLFAVNDGSDILEELLYIYWSGLQECIYFFPETSLAYAEKIAAGQSPQAAIKKAEKEWEKDYGYSKGEYNDPYNKMMIGSENPLMRQAFKDRALAVWQPYFEAQKQEEG